jgi:hypothetical protein
MALKKREILQITPVSGNFQAVFLAEPLIEQSQPVIISIPVVAWALIEEQQVDSGTQKVLESHKSVEGLSISPSEYPDAPAIIDPADMVMCDYFHEFLGYTNDGNIEQFKSKAAEYFKEWLVPAATGTEVRVVRREIDRASRITIKGRNPPCFNKISKL